MARVVLREVSKVFDDRVFAVKDANIDVEDKEFVVLVGPSGCGKSTTLRMIAGLEDVSQGEVYIGDRLVNEVPPKDRDIAMVFQNYALYPHMTVYDNMAFGLKLRKVPRSEIRRRVHEAAEILEIGDLLDRKPRALSGGQRQRVAVGRAIVRDPRVFLFDEPLSNLDAKLRVQMRTELSRLHNRLRSTMIYVTHDQVEAMTMGDRIVVMKEGIVQQIDNPLNLYHDPTNKFVAEFIGSPSMNFAHGKLVREDGLWFVGEGLRVKIPEAPDDRLGTYLNRSVIFGMRPEDIYEASAAPELDKSARVSLTVELVEPMGSEMFLYMRAGDSQLTVRTRMSHQPALGDSLELLFDMSRAHFFDPDTEEVLGSRV